MLISVAIPCYKSSKTIARVVSDIKSVFLQQTEHDYQIILVNDYPFDDTFEVIKGLCEEDEKIIGVNLSRNFGQSAAKMAALQYAEGDVLVFMDDDGQHPVSGIIRLAEKIQEGYDVVFAAFPEKHHSIFKKLTSNINARVMELNGSKVKGVRTSSFYAISRFAIDAYDSYKSPFPSMFGYLNSVCGKTTEIEMEHLDRLEGKSNYTLGKMLKLWLNGFTNFSIVPLRIITGIGFSIAVLGFLFGIITVIRKLVVSSISAGYSSIVSIMLFLGGLVLFSLGFIGEYIGRIYMTVSNLQQYKIKEVINSERDGRK